MKQCRNATTREINNGLFEAISQRIGINTEVRTMNVQLIESLIQVILALPEEEQAVLSKKLAEAQLATTHSQPNPGEADEPTLHPLIAAGRIIPPARRSDIPPLSEADLKVMVSSIQISGKPLSETVIEERGEW
jgi:hypothetical protein